MHDEWSRIKLLHWNAFEVILFLTTNFNCYSIGSNWIAKTSIAKLFVIFRNMNYYANQHQCFSWKSAFSLTWPASMQIYWNKRKSQEFNSHRICLEHQYGRVTSCESALLRSHSYVMNGWRNLVFSYLTYIWMIPLLFNTVWVILKNFIHICFWSFNSVEQTKIKPFQRNSWPC